MKPVVWILAGPNGSGKSTLFDIKLSGLGIEFVNADWIDKTLTEPDPVKRSRMAQLAADTRRNELLAAGDSFATETVFSHVKQVRVHPFRATSGF